MVTLAPFDQRFVRRDEDTFRTTSTAHPLCESCGDEPRCVIRNGMRFQSQAYGVEASVLGCGVYVPVLTFKDDTGIDRTFNTFRRGAGWYRRVAIGTKVRMFSNAIEDFVADGVVVERYLGPLGTLLGNHASMNHLMRDGMYEDADIRLHKILVGLYGKGYAALDEEYSVVYVEVR